jgi:hypothetical protein
MASAIQLTASNTIANGNGLATSANLLAQITTFQSHAPIVTLANIYSMLVNANANITTNVTSTISTLGTAATGGQWLLDFYPSNVTPVATGGVSYYGEYPTITFSGYPLTEHITYSSITGSASFSNTLKNQAQLPFATNGVTEFANVYLSASAYIASHFDSVGSTSLLAGKTYAQSGLGFTGPLDLATMGLGTSAGTLSNTISNWGTMYDVTNMATMGNPYVFGQNLLNQGLGSIGGLATQLSNAGLNLTNLSDVPSSKSTVATKSISTAVSTPIGQVNIPGTANVTTTTVVAGNSPEVVSNIYSTITGSNLAAIISATGITLPKSANVNSLADFLSLTNVVDPSTYSQLSNIGTTNFSTLGTYMQNKLGKGSFQSWTDMSNLLGNLEIPAMNYTSTTASTPILSSAISSSILSTGTGSGPFNTLCIYDFLGAASGIPYTNQLAILNNNYTLISNAINLPSLVSALQLAVEQYINSSGSIGAIATAVNNVNSAVSNIPVSLNNQAQQASAAYYTMLTRLSVEVTNLSNAGVVFNSGSANTLKSFSQSIGSAASDKTRTFGYQFFANLITNDSYGDTIRAAVAETINTQLASSYNITVGNDPQPAAKVVQAANQNIPLSTYISQNK